MRNTKVVCIGAALVDESFNCFAQPIPGTSNPAKYSRSVGGVACNVAQHLSLLGHSVELITHFGNDPDGKWLRKNCEENKIGISHSLVNDSATGKYVALLTPTGELFAGAASTSLENEIAIEFLQQKINILESAALLLLDCNLSTECLEWLINFSSGKNIPCIIEPVSIAKSSRLTHIDINNVLLITPNYDELPALTLNNGNRSAKELIQQLFVRGLKYLWIRNGKSGSRFYSPDIEFELKAPEVKILDATGAGDAALAGWIHGWIMNNTIQQCVAYGHAMASLVLQVSGAIHEKLNIALLEDEMKKIKA